MNIWDFIDNHPILTVVLLLVVGGTMVDLVNAYRSRP